MASCDFDQVTDLPVCDIIDEDRVALHDALAEASDYLLQHHRAATAPYQFRRAYLPGRITGNDVVALSRLGQEMGARYMSVGPELSPFLPVGETGKREYVRADQVEMVADNAGKLAMTVRAALEAIKAWDVHHETRPGGIWVLAAAVGVVAAIGAAVVLR